MLVVTSRCVLANLLAHTDRVAQEKISDFRRLLSIAIPHAYVDIASASIGSALETNPALFKREGDYIVRVADFLTPEFVDDTMNRSLGESARTKIREVCLALFGSHGDGSGDCLDPKHGIDQL